MAARTLALTTLCGVLFLTFLDTTVVSVALGSVQADLHAGVTSLQWIVNSYTLVFAALMLTAGAIGDRGGRRRVMLVGVVVFSAGSVAAALAPTSGALITARVVMGIGAAASEPGTLSILRQLYPEPAARARALGVWSAVAGVALALGPVVGGLLVDTWSWRAVFWLNAILGVVLLALVARFVPESSDPSSARVDLGGFFLGTVGVGGGTVAVIAGETAGYRAPWIVALFILAALGVIGFVIVELRAPAPMLDLRYLRRMVNGALFAGFALYFGVFSIFFFTALYLTGVSDYSGAQVAGVFAPMAMAIAAGSVAGGRWVAARGAREPLAFGGVVAAGGLLLTANLIDPAPSFGRLALALTVAGAGFGLAIVPVAATVLAAFPPQLSGMAASATNTSRQLGAVAGVAVLGSLVNAHLTTDLHRQLVALGVPTPLQTIVLTTVNTGTVPSGGTSSVVAKYADQIGPVLDAAYAAFKSAVVDALVVSAGLILLAAAIGFVTSGRGLPQRPPER